MGYYYIYTMLNNIARLAYKKPFKLSFTQSSISQ